MTLIPRRLLDADDDWIEDVRAWLYPRLHPHLKRYGGYGVGNVYPDQYVGTSYIDEEPLEEELVALGFVRNPVACFKYHTDGRASEGSWALLAADDTTGRLAANRQVHVTLFESAGGRGLDIYAHEEFDWRRAPLKHLREVDFSPADGVSYCHELLGGRSFIDLPLQR